jgi:hypothetical protein
MEVLVDAGETMMTGRLEAGLLDDQVGASWPRLTR